MDTRREALKLARETLKELLECGTALDELYRKFRELRLLEDRSPAFQKALVNTECAFFMVVQSVNVLREQLRLLEVASKKEEIE